MNNEKRSAYEYIDANADAFIGVSDRIWDYAELSLKEFQSAAPVSECLAIRTPVSECLAIGSPVFECLAVRTIRSLAGRSIRCGGGSLGGTWVRG